VSDTLHAAAVDVLGLPVTKRFHRSFPLSAEDFPTPESRSERYTIVGTPRHDGGIRGRPGDELPLTHRVET
jgi:hypothetical protein